ncbi:MAG: radical SAM family heme chaperone HemW [Pseudomonadota bacterium]|nr:radical SAM family heme chaperone HemW [Pseudomonadota bacterium]
MQNLKKPVSATRKKTHCDELALYVHWPFCLSRCPYCDFNAHVRPSVDQEAWRNALISEIKYWSKKSPGRILKSIFFGGGTPTLMLPWIASDIIQEASKHWSFSSDIEITVEANPTSIEIERFKELGVAGVNRISIGVQALDNNALKFLGREHDHALAVSAIKTAEKVFPRYSFDLIYGRPGQNINDWSSELREALNLVGDHISLYQLTIEKGTPFHSETRAGKLVPLDENTSAALFDITQEICDQHRLPAYEVSNHALPGAECRHNLTYWMGGDYIGIGPGAHGRVTINQTVYETEQIPGPEAWLATVERRGHATRKESQIKSDSRIEEIFMMGLRLINGISRINFTNQTGLELEDALDPKRLRRLLIEDYLILDSKGLRATKKGLLRLNAVLSALLS